jgi:hypothetical protein
MMTKITGRGKFTAHLALLAIAAIFAASAYASQGIEEIMLSITSPEDIAQFFFQEFTYTTNLPDQAHSPEETIESRSGDCEDFAILASEMLTRMGVENHVLVIRFRGISVAHAICVWKGKNGLYSFISNRELHHTGQRTVEGAVRKFYPDCETIASIDPKMYSTGGSGRGISAARQYRGAGLLTNLDPRFSAGL